MPPSLEDFPVLCRLCLCPEGNVPIFPESESGLDDLSERIFRCVSIQVRISFSPLLQIASFFETCCMIMGEYSVVLHDSRRPCLECLDSSIVGQTSEQWLPRWKDSSHRLTSPMAIVLFLFSRSIFSTVRPIARRSLLICVLDASSILCSCYS